MPFSPQRCLLLPRRLARSWQLASSPSIDGIDFFLHVWYSSLWTYHVSQFFITTVPTPHLDGKHVVFGELESGSETLMKMSRVETDKRDAPIVMQRVVIEDCGELVEPAASSSKAKKKRKKGHKKARKEKKRQKQNHDDDSENADSEGGGKRNKDKKKKSKAKRKEETRRRSGKGGPTRTPDRCHENGGDNRKAATVDGNGQAAEGKTRVKGQGGRVYRTPSPGRPSDNNNLRGPDVNHDGARRWDGTLGVDLHT